MYVLLLASIEYVISPGSHAAQSGTHTHTHTRTDTDTHTHTHAHTHARAQTHTIHMNVLRSASIEYVISPGCEG